MSDDTATDSGTDSVSEDNAQTTQAEHHDRPAGYSPVSLDDLPPEKQKEIDDRINYLYRQVKDSERSLKDYRSVAQQQAQQINELVNGVGQVVNHLQTRQTADTEADIRNKMQTAWETGDNKTYLAEQERLIDLKSQQKAQPRQQQQAQQRPGSTAQIAQQAQDEGSMTAEDSRLVSAWQNETDERGQPIRSWARTDDPNDPDPDFVKAITVAKRVWEKNPHRSAKENLMEVDRIMGTKQNGGGQTVMGGGLNATGKRSTIKLTPAQERIAVKTKFGAKHGAKSDSDYIAAYRKQIDSIKSGERS